MNKTRSQLIEEITAACAKVNPEIMELKFGCKIQYKGKIGILVKEHLGAWDVLYDDYKNLAPRWKNYETSGLQNAEIFGRDILPHDVLQVLPYLWSIKFDHGLKFVTGYDGENDYFLWQGNTLTDQSDECLQFIASLLPKT